jgi:hypothetical protein
MRICGVESAIPKPTPEILMRLFSRTGALEIVVSAKRTCRSYEKARLMEPGELPTEATKLKCTRPMLANDCLRVSEVDEAQNVAAEPENPTLDLIL